MSFGGAATALGFVGDTIGLFEKLGELFLPEVRVQSADVRISIGQLQNATDTSRSTGGDAPGIALFDAIGTYLGSEVGTTKNDLPDQNHIDRGSSRDYSITTDLAPEFISVVAGGGDGVCIHAITMTDPNGLTYAWTGDIGKACGAEWYPQSQAVDSKPHRPACIWIDTNGDSGHLWKGFNIHLPSFGASSEVQKRRADVWNKDKDLMCKSEPRFSLYKVIQLGNQVKIFNRPYETDDEGLDKDRAQILDSSTWKLSELPDDASFPPCKNGGPCPPQGASAAEDLPRQDPTRRFRRRHVKRQAWMVEKLIVSNFDSHSATELCESGTSNGPDFVSTVEGLFCDMSEKQLWPVCSESTTSHCFDMESQRIKGSGISAPTSTEVPYNNSTLTDVSRIGGSGVPQKSYTNTLTWG